MPNNSMVNGTKSVHSTDSVLSIHNPKFVTYMVVCSLLILKMWWLTVLTIMKRFKHKVVLNDEDTKTTNATVGSHPAVERVRRAFQNDLENIPAFLFIALVYLFVPAPNWLVHLLYYTYLLARIGHSIIYTVYILPQPSRGICFGLSFIIVLYMCLHVLIAGFINYGKKHKM